MRSIALAFLVWVSLGVAASPGNSSVDTTTEQWMREYINGLGQEALAHRTYLRQLFTIAVVGAGILGGFVVWFSWQNRKDIKQIGRYSNEEIDKKIQEYMNELKRQLLEHRAEVRTQLDQKTQTVEKVIQDYINADAVGSLKRVVSFILESTLSKYEFYHLDRLDNVKQHSVKYSDALVRDVRRLEALNFINGIDNEPGHEAILRMIKEQSSSKTEFDLKQFFQITERGEEYLEQRKT